MNRNREAIFRPIGVIHTPFREKAPFHGFEEAEGEFCVELFPEFTEGLYRLDSFSHCWIIFWIDRPEKKPSMRVHPPRGNGLEAGLFATRSPHRPNSIGLTLVKILRIKENKIYTSGMDILDQTPLLDIKPYIPDKEAIADAAHGWIPRDQASSSDFPG
ncbi:MAG: hypothetical protein Kow00127_00830 [Bacteroidales bacterium]